eukprot:TRINITY_DN478_c0_g1_i2.p1 TRINITY_DN478_c0_g1~~TRINITY_DN478_c0_g1_i2.p1  ORF type:complete len:141 (-),score=25.94 TRINITY_DN478_c0_g1_i2:187-609(-)
MASPELEQALQDIALNKKTSIDLRRCNIDDEGVARLAEALKTNTTVTELDLSENRITAASGARLAEVLKTNTTLTRLVLFINSLLDEGVEHLEEALRTNTTLTYIDVGANDVCETLFFSVQKMVVANRERAKGAPSTADS